MSAPSQQKVTSPQRMSSLLSPITGSRLESSSSTSSSATAATLAANDVDGTSRASPIRAGHRGRAVPPPQRRSSSSGGPSRPVTGHGKRGGSGGLPHPPSGKAPRPAYIQIPPPVSVWSERAHAMAGQPTPPPMITTATTATSSPRPQESETASLPPPQTPSTPLSFASSAVAQIRKKSSYFFGGRSGRKNSWMSANTAPPPTAASTTSTASSSTASATAAHAGGVPHRAHSSAASASGISMWTSGGLATGGTAASDDHSTRSAAASATTNASKTKAPSLLGPTDTSPPRSLASSTPGPHSGPLRKKMSLPALRQHSRSGSLTSSISHHHHQLSASGIPFPLTSSGGSSSIRLGHSMHHHRHHLPRDQHARKDSQSSSGGGSASGGMSATGSDAPSAVSLRNPAEFMIHALFVEFAAAAEGKLAWVMKHSLDQEPDMAGYLRHGADPEFDKLLVAIGAIARQRPNDVVDALMLWRKSKLRSPDGAWNRHDAIAHPRSQEVYNLQRQRCSNVCTITLFRALIEVVRQLHDRTLLEELGRKLEDLVFKQIDADPDLVSRSFTRKAIMTLFADLIGWLSNVRFVSVSDRFIAELEKLPPDADGKENRKTEMLIRSMRFLRVKASLYPETALQDASDFLQSIAKFFASTHSFKVKHAYAQLLIELLLPLAPHATVEVNYPGWSDAISILYPRAFKMATKPKHWTAGFPFLTTILCVSKREFFLEKWPIFLEVCAQKLKDKHMRLPALNAVARLVWVYLFRCKESFNVTSRRIESVIRALFPAGKRYFLPTDASGDALVIIMRIIISQDIDYGTKHYVPFLLGGLDPAGNTTWGIEQLIPERGAIAIRAYLLALMDAEQANKAAFPPGNDLRTLDPSLLECSLEPLPDALLLRKSIHDADERMSDVIGKIWVALDDVFGNMLLLDDRYLNQRNMFTFSGAVVNAAKELTSDTNQSVYAHLTTLNVGYSPEKQPYFDLLRCCVDAVPRCMPAGLRTMDVVEMLCRYTAHVDPDLALAAARALLRLGHQRGGYIVVSGMSKFIGRVSDQFAELLVGSFAHTSHGEEFSLLNLYVQLLELWSDEMLLCPTHEETAPVTEQISRHRPDASDATAVAVEVPRFASEKGPTRFTSYKMADFDSPDVWNLIEETEANGLILLSNHSILSRRYAVRVLRLAVEVEQQFEEHSFIRKQRHHDQGHEKQPSAASALSKLSELERQPHVVDLLDLTLAEFQAQRAAAVMASDAQQPGADDPGPVPTSAYGSHGAREKRGLGSDLPGQRLRDLAVSEQPEHQLAWQRNFVEFVNACFERCPIAVAHCRNTACIRLARMNMMIAMATDIYSHMPDTPMGATLPTAYSLGGSAGSVSVSGAGSTVTVSTAANPPAVSTSASNGGVAATSGTRGRGHIITDHFLHQWSLYLRFACATMTVMVDPMPPPQSSTFPSTPTSLYAPSLPVSGINASGSGGKSARQRSAYPAAVPGTPGFSKKQMLPMHSEISTARDLFNTVIPYLNYDTPAIREAVVEALGQVNRNVFPQLMDELQPLVRSVLEDYVMHRRESSGSAMTASTGHKSGQRSGRSQQLSGPSGQHPGMHPRGIVHVSSPSPSLRRNRRLDHLRIDLTRIYQMLSRYLRYDEFLKHVDIVTRMSHWLKETLDFLTDSEVQMDWEFHELRRHFAGLAENLCWHLPRNASLCSRAMPFEFRLDIYHALEGWCGHGRQRDMTHRREHNMMQAALNRRKHVADKGHLTLALEDQRHATGVAALRAMAACCRGPIVLTYRDKRNRSVTLAFGMNGIHDWIESVFASPDRRFHSIAGTALESLLTFNADRPEIFDTIIRRCYRISEQDANTQGYFLALVDILTRARSYPFEVHVILSLALFKAADPNPEVRRTAVRLLRILEERFLLDSSASEFEVALYSSLTTVYKQAQYALSARLAQRHPDITYEVLSETMHRLDTVSSQEAQRDMLISLVPWLANVQLAMDPDIPEEVAVSSHIVLSNLFYMTVNRSDIFHSELQQAWEQLVAGERVYNARIIIVFLLHLGLEKRNPSFITYAKRVIVYLGRTGALDMVVDALVEEITPRALVPEKRTDIRQYDKVPRVRMANVDDVLGAYPKRPEFSRGQLATVLLVDLTIEAGPRLLPHLATILHAAAVQFDNNILIVAEHVRLLLSHLICSVFFGRPASAATAVISAASMTLTLSHQQKEEEDVKSRARELINMLGVDVGLTQPSTAGSYHPWLPRPAHTTAATPARRSTRNASITEPLVNRLVQLFAYEDPEIGQRWGEMALHWGTQCPLRKAACGSFRVFRMLSPHFNEAMLAEILRRLSNTVSDQSDEIQEFSLEILITLKSMLEPLTSEHILAFPEAFWASVAILYTGVRSEYAMGLEMLSPMLERIDFDDPTVQETLSENFPAGWNAEFDGLLPLLAKGLRCQETEPRCLRMMNRLVGVDGDALIDPTESRYLFALLANLPWFTRTVSEMSYDDRVTEAANLFATVAEQKGQEALQRTMDSLARRRFRPKDDFVRQVYLALRDVYFPRYEWHALTFIAELLANQTPWYKRSVLHILRTFLTFIDLRRGDGQDEPSGTEIVIAPLLRLLPTEFADDALEVLEVAMQACTPASSSVSSPISPTSPASLSGLNGGGANGPVHPNFSVESMTRAHVITSIAQREFETVPSIFRSAANGGGSFASIPFVADFGGNLHATRQNVTAVLHACAETVGMSYEDAPMVYLSYDNQSVFDFTGGAAAAAAAAAAGAASLQPSSTPTLMVPKPWPGQPAMHDLLEEEDMTLAGVESTTPYSLDDAEGLDGADRSLDDILTKLDDLDAFFGDESGVPADAGAAGVDVEAERLANAGDYQNSYLQHELLANEPSPLFLDSFVNSAASDPADVTACDSPSLAETDGHASGLPHDAFGRGAYPSTSHTTGASEPGERRVSLSAAPGDRAAPHQPPSRSNSLSGYNSIGHRAAEHFRFPAPPISDDRIVVPKSTSPVQEEPTVDGENARLRSPSLDDDGFDLLQTLDGLQLGPEEEPEDTDLDPGSDDDDHDIDSSDDDMASLPAAVSASFAPM